MSSENCCCPSSQQSTQRRRTTTSKTATVTATTTTTTTSSSSRASSKATVVLLFPLHLFIVFVLMVVVVTNKATGSPPPPPFPVVGSSPGSGNPGEVCGCNLLPGGRFSVTTTVFIRQSSTAPTTTTTKMQCTTTTATRTGGGQRRQQCHPVRRSSRVRRQRQKRTMTFRLCAPGGGGQGGTASVYRAVDEANGRCVAVKVLTLTHGESQSQRDSQRRQFKHEESILRRFDRLRVEKKWSYPHIVRRIISGDAEIKLQQEARARTRMVIVEELGKENLEEYWRKRADHLGPFRKRGDEIMDVLWDMLLALQEFHEEAYHLDFKPKNQIMVESTTRSNKDGTPVTTLKLIDFGASKFKKAQGNLELHIPCVALTSNFGTANYMSQEQLASCSMVDNRRGTSTTTNVAVSKKRKMEFPPAAIDHRRPDTRTRIRTKRDVAGGGYQYHHKVSEKSDIWALGVTLYQLVFHYTEPPIKLEPEEIKHPWAHDMENTPPRWSHVESIRTKHHALMIDISHFMPELDGWLKDEHYARYLPRFLNVIQACLQFEPELRPTAAGIIDYLNGDCHFLREIDVQRGLEARYGKNSQFGSKTNDVNNMRSPLIDTSSEEQGEPYADDYEVEEERLAVIKAAQGRGEHLSRAQVNHLRQNTKERFVLASLVAHLPVHVLRRFRHESDKRKTKVLCELHLEDPVFVPPPGDSRGEEDEDVGERGDPLVTTDDDNDWAEGEVDKSGLPFD